jgi:acyl-CoA synthetase (AMP-forming)/AMP-acid ligase II
MSRKAIIPQGIELGITIGQLLDRITGHYGNMEAIVIDEYRKTWSQFLDDVNRFAVGLDILGLKKGDRIGVWSVNLYEWLICWFALPKLGVILVPYDSWYKPEEAQYITKHSGAKAIVCTSNYISQIQTFRDIPSLEYIILMDGTKDKDENDKRIRSFKSVAVPAMTPELSTRLKKVQDSVDPEEVTFILYTSGTTGQPKGAMLTHNNIIGNVLSVADVMQCTNEDVYLIPVPFSHCFGCVLGISLATITGSKMVPLKDQTPTTAIRTIEKEKATVLHGTPTHFIRYIKEWEEHPVVGSKLRTGIIAGAPCPPEVLKGIINIMKIPDIIIGYGQTESSPIITLTKPDDSFEHRIDSVGTPIPHVEVRVVDVDNIEVPIGEAGELVCRGPNVMKGYYNEPQKTAETIDKEGWLHTGDLATKDADGYYKIVGRIKDMIIYGGSKVYPKIVENFLLENPKILEVAVVGVPDFEYGEVVALVARVEPGYTEQDIVDYCYGKIGDNAVPRYVRIDLPIPISGRGKIQKFKLREDLKKMLKEGTLGPKIVPTAVKNKKKA